MENIITKFIVFNESVDGYSKWKRNNVTLRGVKEIGKDNGVYGSFGKGLYTVPLSNKGMAKQYGKVYFVVNARPKNPKILQSLNDAEIFNQKLISDYCKENGEDYSPRYFNENTSIEVEAQKAGYDGIIIKGREMVNYTPTDIKYFENEDELKRYYNSLNI